jgi:hypothetical protein
LREMVNLLITRSFFQIIRLGGASPHHIPF